MSFYTKIYGCPVPQPRPRVVRFRNGSMGAIRNDRVYNWKMSVFAGCKQFQNAIGPNVPCAVVLRFCFERPKSHKNARGELKPSAPHDCDIQSDVDNLAKPVLDGMTWAKVWTDDKQVVQLTVTKEWTPHSENQGVEINFSRIP